MQANCQRQINQQKSADDIKENQLQALIDKQQIHITALTDENTNLKEQNSKALEDKEGLQKEVMSSSDYIVAIQEKCYQSNQ